MHGTSFITPDDSFSIQVHSDALGAGRLPPTISGFTCGASILAGGGYLGWRDGNVGKGLALASCVLSFRHGSSSSHTEEVSKAPSPAALVVLLLLLCSIFSVLL